MWFPLYTGATFFIHNAYMIIVEVKDGEPIDKALRRYKKKFERLGILKQVRGRAYHTPDSVERRLEIKKAVRRQRYIQQHEL